VSRRRQAAALPGRWLAVLALGGLMLLGPIAVPAAAEVVGLDVARREPVAGGKAWGLAGPYEKLVGTVRFAVDPENPANARIVDLDRAPRGVAGHEDGRVHFRADFYILKPVDPSKGNGALFLEVPNRGGKAIVRYFDRGAARTFDPTSAEDFGDGFLLRRGFTLAWVGWQWDIPRAVEGEPDDRLKLDPVPVVADPPAEGPVEGLVRSDNVFSEPATVFELGHRGHVAYPVEDPADPRNVLTVRDARLAPRRTIPREEWRFEGTSIVYPAGFVPGKIYEAVYVSDRPVVVGLGLAAVRDFVSYLRYAEGSPAPVERALGMGISQTGRFLRQFLWQGMNVDEAGRPAFDGLMVHTAGAGRGSFNHRFAQPSRDAHPYSAFFYPTDVFPFTGAAQADPETGRTDGLLEALGEQAGPEKTRVGAPSLPVRGERDGVRGAIPRIIFTNTGYEYWGRAASLIHTTLDGRADMPLDPRVRIYHLAGAQHFVDRFPPERAATRYPANPNDFLWSLRALLVALDSWVADGTEPPPSRYPRVDDGTLTAPADLAFPQIPGIQVPERPHEAYRMDYGPRFWSEGIVTKQPPVVGKPFGVRVPQVDADGNPRSGLRMPEVAVPLSTYTPWNWRAEEIGASGELADFRGSFLPLPATAEERRAAGDPRESLEERYGGFDAYLGRYAAHAARLAREGYLLDEDLPELLDRAEALWREVAGDGEGQGPVR